MRVWPLSLLAVATLSAATGTQSEAVVAERQAIPSHDNLEQQTPEQLIAGAENAHPATLYVLAAKLMRAGRRDDAVCWFYIGQLRYRFHLLTNPPDAADERVLFSALSESVGRPVNEYAFGNVDSAVREIDAALVWDMAHRNHFTSRSDFPAQFTTTREGLIALRNDMLARKNEIREKRTSNGLPNR